MHAAPSSCCRSTMRSTFLRVTLPLLLLMMGARAAHPSCPWHMICSICLAHYV